MSKATEKQQILCIVHIIKAKRLKYEKELVVCKEQIVERSKNPTNVAHVNTVKRELVLTDMQSTFM